jgi:hypothetical protein
MEHRATRQAIWEHARIRFAPDHGCVDFLSSPDSIGRSSTPGLLSSIAGVSGILGRPLLRAMTTGAPPRSRRAARPRFAKNFSRTQINEGAGNAGCAMHPRPRMQNKTKHTSVVTTGSPETYRHSLHDGVTAAPCSPWCTGLFSHHRLRKLLPTNLTPASGCQDHTAWPSASGSVRPGSRSRPSHPAPRQRRSRAAPL